MHDVHRNKHLQPILRGSHLLKVYPWILQSSTIQDGSHKPHVAAEPLKRGWLELRYAVSVTYTMEFKDLLWAKGCLLPQ